MGTNTGLGIGIGIPFKNNALGGDRPYLPPELKARLIGVWDNYGKKNTDADRNIIKNKIHNAGGDLEILNSAYRLNSGFGEYSNDFQEYTYSENVVVKDNTNAIFNSRGKLLVPYSYLTKDIPSFKIKVSGLSNTYHFRYYYRDSNGVQHSVDMAKDGNYELPICYNVQSSSDGTSCGFTNYGSDIVSVEILPEYEGAFVTDGVNDMIISQKTLQEMGVTKDFTIVSMIHQITLRGATAAALTNYIRKPIGHEYVRNRVANIGKTGIYGYVVYDVNHSSAGNSHIINTILGDKNDYSMQIIGNLSQGKFSVQGYINGEDNVVEISRVAHYWTFALLGKATEDDINLIIGYFNLDRTLKADIYCNIEKQGITNDNHADFNDKLIDYSGNGRDIQMNNLAWKGGSGIAAKQYETFKDWLSESSSTSIIKQIDEFTRIVESTTNGYWVSRIRRDSDLDKVYDPINVYLYQDNNFLIHECKYEVDGVKYSIPIYESVGKGYHKLEIYTKDRYTELPENAEKVVLSEWYFPKSNKGSIKYSLIPSYKGGILLDGVNDFGKVTGMPVYKDYTVVTDREIFSNTGAILSKNNPGAFVETTGNSIYSFGQATSGLNFISTRSISYLSKYSYCGQSITPGAAEDGTDMWLGTIRDNDSRFFNGVIYSLMSFPYSMSKFLIERQLKKHKLGTLYPDMVEFRPIVKSNSEYQVVDCYIDTFPAVVGNYYPINSKLRIAVTTKGAADEVTSLTVNGVSLGTPSVNGNRFTFNGTLSDKSPQKINVTIDEYIRYEDIVQPYPVLLRFNDENGNEVSWGGKFKVGSTITRIGSAADSNLLPNIYNIFGLLLNGNQVTSSKVIVEKTMVFKAKSAYIFDNNEPKCILSPRLLRIPNSSYKILGHIPDISGHGNHGKINNSAYAEGSGVNEDGSYQFDGVDDFVTIPTTVGGKQVLMKVNWNSPNASVLYDQRSYNNEFAIYTSKNDSDGNPIPAYQGRNNGQTYIDGILNSNIKAPELRAITHNITITNELSSGANKTHPIIGSSKSNAYFANMALYDFMLFDEISTDDKILELNEYVGIEGNTE